jgi:low affinity Fe/Cu permease
MITPQPGGGAGVFFTETIVPSICLSSMPAAAISPFTRFARATSRVAGRPVTFAIAVFVVVAWAVSGPLFGFSEAWQLTINTLTTIATFLMVFLIQATQNREAEAIQLKLDELILALDSAHNELIDSEDLPEAEQLKLHKRYLALAQRAHERLEGKVEKLEEKRKSA